MSIDQQEQMNEYAINAYNDYLSNFIRKELLQYFQELDNNQLIVCIKYLYENDGCLDCNFES